MFWKKTEESHNPERHSVLANRQGIALVAVDIQEKFAPAIPEFDKIVKNAVALIKSFQMFGLPILVTEQYPKGLGKTVKPVADCFPIMEVIEKTAFSCVQEKHFLAKLDALKMRNVVLCGIESHVCIHQTAHDLFHRGYRVWVVADATGSRNPANKELALTRMMKAGILITSAEMLLFEMTFQSGTESFKQVLELVK